MGERPILFSAPMVRAILEGRKTQTRRVVKITHRTPGLAACLEPPHGLRCRPTVAAELCPYGQPGDRLWVRETWSHTGTGVWTTLDASLATDGRVIYRATDPRPRPVLWWPSIHMPRWASRLTLEVTGVRVERLQDISEADAMAEGAEPIPCEPASLVFGTLKARFRHRDGYRKLWESINGAGSWDANPWVWVVEFAATPKGGANADS